MHHCHLLFFLILPLQKHTCHCVCLCEYICVNAVRVCVCPTRSNTNNLLLKMQMDSICGPLLSVSGWAFWGKFLCMQLCGRCVIRRNVSVYACTQTRCQLYLMHLFNTVFVCCDSADSKKDICVLSGCVCARENARYSFTAGFEAVFSSLRNWCSVNKVSRRLSTCKLRV